MDVDADPAEIVQLTHRALQEARGRVLREWREVARRRSLSMEDTVEIVHKVLRPIRERLDGLLPSEREDALYVVIATAFYMDLAALVEPLATWTGGGSRPEDGTTTTARRQNPGLPP